MPNPRTGRTPQPSPKIRHCGRPRTLAGIQSQTLRTDPRSQRAWRPPTAAGRRKWSRMPQARPTRGWPLNKRLVAQAERKKSRTWEPVQRVSRVKPVKPDETAVGGRAGSEGGPTSGGVWSDIAERLPLQGGHCNAPAVRI